MNNTPQTDQYKELISHFKQLWLGLDGAAMRYRDQKLTYKELLKLKENTFNEIEQALIQYIEKREVVCKYKLKAAQRLVTRSKPLDNGCIEWLGSKNQRGYGTMAYNDGEFKTDKVHRVAYHLFVGDIGSMTIDHLCGNTLCVNVEHMMLATKAENTRRGNKPLDMIDYCNKGHKYEGDNLRMRWTGSGTKRKWVRSCVTCKRANHRDYLARRKALTNLKEGNHD